MLERAHVRCSACRSPVPALVLWAVGDICPRCDTSLRRAGGRTSEPPAPASGIAGPVVGGRDVQHGLTPTRVAMAAVSGRRP